MRILLATIALWIVLPGQICRSGQIHDPSAESLFRTLEEGNWKERGDAIRGLTAMRHPRLLEALLDLLAGPADEIHARRVAVWALGEIGGGEALEALRRTVKDRREEAKVRVSAAQALGTLKDGEGLQALREVLSDPREGNTLRSAAARALAAVGGSEAVTVLSEVLISKSQDSSVRFAALGALERLRDPRSTDAIAALLDEAEFRKSAAAALGRLGSPRALPALRDLLDDGDLGTRKEAILSLGALRDGASVKDLAAILEEREAGLRPQTVSALASIGSDEAVDALIRALDHTDKDLFSAAVTALGAVGDKRALEPLLDAVKRGDAGTLVASLEMMGLLGGEEMVPRIIPFLSKPPREKRLEAVKALVAAGGDEAWKAVAAAVAHEDPTTGLAAARALERRPSTDPALLQEAIRSPIDKVRLLAVRTLGRMGNPAALPLLIDALDDDSPRVLRDALETIAALTGDGPAEPLAAAFDTAGKGTRRHLLRLMGAMSDGQSRSVLTAALAEGDLEIRLTALTSLWGRPDDGRVATLGRALRSADWEVRLAGVSLARQWADPAVSEHVKAAIDDVHPLVSRQAAAVLARWEGGGKSPPIYAFGPEEEQPCRFCHPDVGFQAALFPHAPADGGECEACHLEHGDDGSFLLKDDVDTLCLGCHVKMDEYIKASNVRHGAFGKGRDNCLTCHFPHGSKARVFLREPKGEVCFGCHEELGRAVRRARSVHEPAALGRCDACHASHGGSFADLLKKFEISEWPIYGVRRDRVCRDCHTEDLFRQDVTRNATAFRDGLVNLHTVHLSRRKGRTCITCHDPHAADQDVLMRPDVPFGTGGWKLPIEFTKVPEGGYCVVGCHRSMSYSRRQGREN